jgi:hypothetical protein
MDEAAKIDPTFSKLMVIIPANLESYIEDTRANGCLPPVTMNDVNNLAELLRRMKKTNPKHLVEMPYDTITQEHYDLRDTEEVRLSNELYAFQVNGSTGTQDTITKAVRYGVKVGLHEQYRI